VGINDNFIKQVFSEITPGTSALFVMTSAAVMDKVDDAWEGMDAKLLSTNLTKEQALRDGRSADQARAFALICSNSCAVIVPASSNALADAISSAALEPAELPATAWMYSVCWRCISFWDSIARSVIP
jgi:hypothetical protein